MKETPSSPRARQLARIGAAFVLVPACAMAACAPRPTSSENEAPVENTRLTSIEPAPVADSELTPTDRGDLPKVCDEVGLSVAEISQITGISLASSEPAPPGGRPEMCAYGGSWDDPASLFLALEGNKDEPATSASATTTSATAGATSTSEAEESEDEDSDEDDDRLTAENSVFVSARELHDDDTPEELLESIPEIAGPLYTCALDSHDVEVPELESSGYASIDNTSESDGVSALGAVSGYGMPTQLGTTTSARPTSTTTSGAATSSAKASATRGGDSGSARTSAAASSRDQETVELEILRCDSDPTGHVPHVQAFFVTDEQLWQVSMTVSARDAKDLTIDQEAEGLFALAAHISENV